MKRAALALALLAFAVCFALLIVAPRMSGTEQALSSLREQAERGSADAQFRLGDTYWQGHGLPQDHEQALIWFRKAAEQGNAQAQSRIGTMYANGLSVERDEAQAVFWYRKAAEQGEFEAQFQLGWRYEDGRGVAQDNAQALFWYRKAAQQGHPYTRLGADRLDPPAPQPPGWFERATEWFFGGILRLIQGRQGHH
jgi:TPR repeat protein